MSQRYVRLDDRLLHTEVLYSCIHHWKIEHLILSSYLPLLNEMEPELSLPDGVTSISLTPDAFSLEQLGNERPTLILLGTPRDLLEIMNKGLKTTEVFLANREKRPKTVPLSETYHIDRDECIQLKTIQNLDVNLILQRVPALTPRLIHENLLNLL